MQQTGKVDGLLLISSVGSVNLNEFSMTNNLLKAVNTNLTEIFANLLSQESKEVYYVFSASLKVLAQLWILCSHTHRTGIGITLTHHYATQNNQWQCTKRELVGTKHRHDDHILGSLQLSVGLQANLVTQTIHYQCLLCLSKSYFW